MDREIKDHSSHEHDHIHTYGVCSIGDGAVDSKNAPIRAGYGRCSVSGCGCEQFMGSDELCGNCHHNYSLHY